MPKAKQPHYDDPKWWEKIAASDAMTPEQKIRWLTTGAAQQQAYIAALETNLQHATEAVDEIKAKLRSLAE